MCVRINNVHTVINIFAALEEHLYSCTRMAMPKPISAFGYVSSDPGELSPRPMTDKSLAPNPHHNLPENETTSEGPASTRDARRGMLTEIFTLHACVRGKVISFVCRLLSIIVCCLLSTCRWHEIATSQDLGIDLSDT